jgi:hypothetical protein
MVRSIIRIATLFVAALSLAGGMMPVRAAELSGVSMPDTVNVGGVDLVLNGLGLRTVFIVKAFVAGLYVPQRSQDAAELIAQKGPRRLQMKMLVDMSPDRLMKTFQDGLNAHLATGSLVALRPQAEQLQVLLRQAGYARKGDVIGLDLIDGAMLLSVNGQPSGEPIPGEDFFAALLRGFIGERATDKGLRRGLLGE